MDRHSFISALGQLGLSQAKFGRIIGKHKNTVNEWALGHQPVPQYAAVILDMALTMKSLHDRVFSPLK